MSQTIEFYAGSRGNEMYRCSTFSGAKTKRIYVGDVMAEIDAAINDEPEAWGPHIGPSELERTDQLRRSLKSDDFKEASKEARLYSDKPSGM